MSQAAISSTSCVLTVNTFSIVDLTRVNLILTPIDTTLNLINNSFTF